jgi:hypothetical protein
LNAVQPLPGFVYQQTEMVYEGKKAKRIQVTLEPHGGMRALFALPAAGAGL